MRCYFHLSKGSQTIKDDHGIEIGDLSQARDEIVRAIVETRASNPRLAGEAAGWTLTVADASGTVLLTIPLDSWLAS